MMARAALRSKRLAGVVAAQTWDLQRPGQPPRMLINTNKLLWRYRGADGVKTGWIAESGQNVVASATRNGWQLITVLLNAPQMNEDAAALLDYGFAAFVPVRVAPEGQVMTSVPVHNGGRVLQAAVPDEVMAVVRRGAAIASRVQITKRAAPIRQGEVVGTVVFSSDGSDVAQSTLVAAEAVPVRSLWVRLAQWVRRVLGR
jgi:D-alanyl-D-alanine carboxypeptidase (penicillin-binding protein 5/6)